MNPSKGIFGNGPESPDSDDAASSPFQALSHDNSEASPPNPFANPRQEESPFAAGNLDSIKSAQESASQSKPEGEASPFQLAEPEDGFGYDAPSAATSPFSASPAQTEPPQLKPAAAPVPAPSAGFRPAASAPPPVQAPAQAARLAMPAPDSTPEESYDPAEIRQLELRAIFGVDRELSADEILQRLRSLAGIRNVTRVGADALSALDVLKRNLASLVRDAAPMRVTFGGSPVEFIRSGDICLAVINDGSFAPGVKETIIIAARELARMS